MKGEITADISSANVFADLGFDNPEEELLKAELAREIRAIIKRRRLTKAKSAEMLGIGQRDVSDIVVGRTGKFSLHQLIRCFDQLDHKVDTEDK
ncbi:XRE family transcriptional regulator [Mesorhizobium sp. M7A.F.Ca.US.006.04.2.1]|uniref:helix-turn-helix domain-containing protein n=1 Tax=unclassified Mesorhizobium TaxID=325217 RepID=UPI000FCAF8FC|nr:MULTISPECIES: helix-turn-helix transcriptional regulator [unclassified Mesorhizobium]RUX78261.1 XRE family transcriptional regulator [Mesorhizobium sp. M7A.F.Ca.US.005.03.1.1]RUY18876.1 XRE family transcriptional regulator [Mesorhizobium sp. M7A.F.Ca.US.005.03.2.1]RUY32198.1 XRE family transcriptional regulator [Mesorhizobium sp. M7A.F.Ca.US.001.04.2.1]RUY43294.1 XRE family transcriptional regulator [Mesorhizobium sp. M7A.F.Ca.US.001.04.1.1]RVA95449.1 XRE family transcriptional regulator [M